MTTDSKLFSDSQLANLQQWMTSNGADPNNVAADLGMPGLNPGQVAERRLKQLQDDPDWRSKFHAGGAEQLTEFHRLTGMVAYQQDQDAKAELAKARESLPADGYAAITKTGV